MKQDVNLSADDWWSLKLDSSFDRFCAEAEACTFTIIELEHSTDDSGEPTVTCSSEVSAEESPLPNALQSLLGGREFSLVTTSYWYPNRHDYEHRSRVETSPKAMSKRAIIRIESWAEDLPGSASRCRVFDHIQIECNAFYQVLSRLLEAGLEKRLRDTYPKVAALAFEYWHHKQSYRILLDTPETLDRALFAPPELDEIVVPSAFAVANSIASTTTASEDNGDIAGPVESPPENCGKGSPPASRTRRSTRFG